MESIPAVTELPAPGDWRRHDADLTRAAAAILIANSHLEPFYPRAWMAGDGLTGNALFYFLSGFGVSLAASTRRDRYGPWMGRRLLRLYPTVIVAGLVIQIGLMGDRTGWTVGRAFATFVFPTQYGYVGDVVLIYAGLYWLLRSPRALAAVTVAAAVGCVVSYAAVVRQMVPGQRLGLGATGQYLHRFYFTAIALGGALFGPATGRPRGTTGRDVGLLAVAFAGYVGVKYAMVTGHGARAFLALHALVAIVCVLAVRVSAADPVRTWLRRAWPLGWIASVLAAVTLEMYVVQFWSHQWPPLRRLRFPLNVAAFWAVTVTGAVALWAAVWTVGAVPAFIVRRRRTVVASGQAGV